MQKDTGRYSSLMIAIHWLTAVLVVVAYLVSEPPHEEQTNPSLVHFICGLAVLVLVLPRLIARAGGGAPAPLPGIAPLLALAAKLGHAALYLLLIAVPLTGWYAVSRLGVKVALFGFTLPPLAAAVHGDIGPVAEIHQVGGNAILILAGLHAAMGLWHQFVRRDHTLERMSPFR